VEVLPIQLPGRGKRFKEPAITKSTILVSLLVDAVRPFLDRPFALFGHSLGALIAFELAGSLQELFGIQPMRLFISGCVAPQDMYPADSISVLPEEEFIAELRKLNGTPQELLDDPSLLKVFLPTLRADFSLLGSFARQSRFPLGCPIVAFCGTHDTQASHDSMLSWKDLTTARFDLNLVPGDHFFIQRCRTPFLKAFKSHLDAMNL
jgi:medium-chain acyl-[acyl-carrier-protein] hydrolase